MRSFVRISRIALAASFLAFFGARDASAVIYYFEFGGGLAKMKSASALYSTSTQKAPDSMSGGAGQATLGFNLQESQRGLLLQLGLQGRYVSASGHDLLATYPIARLELWRLGLTFGYTPFLWDGIGFKKLSGASSAMVAELVFLMPITPEIDFGLSGGMQWVTLESGGKSPSPSTEYGAFFRLNFGMSDNQASERRKFKGWRYPFGVPLH